MTDVQPLPSLGPRAITGSIGDFEVVATAVGVGTRRAAEITERLLSSLSVPHVFVVGIAGASAPHLKIADVVVPETVIHERAGTTHTSSTHVAARDRKGVIRTSDDLLVDPDGVAALHRQGIVAMDMETGAIAAVCERHGVPWSAFRAISDNVDRPVDPASMTMLNPDGTPNVGASIKFMLRRPHRIPVLIRSGRDSVKACNAAAASAVKALENL